MMIIFAALFLLFIVVLILNLPSITIAGIPLGIVSEGLKTSIRYYMLWLIYMLLVVGSIYLVYKAVEKGRGYYSKIKKFIDKYFYTN
jgi:hypothetical protein